MEMPKRKPIRLNGYDYSQNGAYFVTVCTKDRKPVLSCIVGDGFPVPQLTKKGKILQAFIEKIPDKYPNVQIDHSVIMPNHVHLIVHIQNHDGQSGTGNPSPTVGTVMGWWKYQTTKAIREIDPCDDEKLWQRSYYDHVIRGEDDYRAIWQYIDENPVKWHLDELYIR